MNYPVLGRDLMSKIYKPSLVPHRYWLYLLTFIPGTFLKSLAFVGSQGIAISNGVMYELQSRLIAKYWMDRMELRHCTTQQQIEWIEQTFLHGNTGKSNDTGFPCTYAFCNEIAQMLQIAPNAIDDPFLHAHLAKSQVVAPEISEVETSFGLSRKRRTHLFAQKNLFGSQTSLNFPWYFFKKKKTTIIKEFQFVLKKKKKNCCL
ncbi:hypothetical protein RFI_19682 [Reticulomyxa filosa]|uniref:Uncharacterized protein n=1 Tax=Reticulomyxa filosa TaxID=46433 RepID=X6MVF9_RETFI|nr:hypothetical protein RFI_19682 [Reticulomyxa filosa]|eukprot:ETO17636.1 hypothetical protein RFI_19682 [Reticulomyxa filosa]